jgi:hypothetical protein
MRRKQITFEAADGSPPPRAAGIRSPGRSNATTRIAAA